MPRKPQAADILMLAQADMIMYFSSKFTWAANEMHLCPFRQVELRVRARPM